MLEAVRSLDGLLDVVTDSTYVANCFRDSGSSGGASGGGRTRPGKPVANRDLWEPLDRRLRGRTIRRSPLGQGPLRRCDERPRRPPRGRGLPAPARGHGTGLMLVGVDTGGTFTDLVGDDGTIVKVPSTPDDPGRAVADAARGNGCQHRAAGARHDGGHQRAPRAARRRGRPRDHRGHEDVLEIARQDRPSLYDPFADRPEPLVPRHLRFGVPGRLDADRSRARSRRRRRAAAVARRRRRRRRVPAARRPRSRATSGRWSPSCERAGHRRSRIASTSRRSSASTSGR